MYRARLKLPKFPPTRSKRWFECRAERHKRFILEVGRNCGAPDRSYAATNPAWPMWNILRKTDSLSEIRLPAQRTYRFKCRVWRGWRLTISTSGNRERVRRRWRNSSTIQLTFISSPERGLKSQSERRDVDRGQPERRRCPRVRWRGWPSL